MGYKMLFKGLGRESAHKLKYSALHSSLMRYVEGSVLTECGFIDGYVGFEAGVIKEVGRGRVDYPLAKGIILPTLVNSHTHLADHIVPIDLALSLEETVAPPSGLKHRILRKTPSEVLVRSMRMLSRYMFRRGTSRLIDFREGGVEGARQLSSLGEDRCRPVILGRPEDLDFDKEEMTQLLKAVDGVGLSSVSDWDSGTIAELASLVRSKGKMFAIHASERVRENLDQILDLRPSFLVHMTMASHDDIATCAQEGVPIVVCPRSNLFFGKIPPLKEMIEAGVTLALGTDNAMFSVPDMLTEMEFAGRLLRHQGIRNVDCVIDMVVKTGREILNQKVAIGIEPDSPCDFMVVGSRNGDAATDLVLRSAADDPKLICLGKKVWRVNK
jgi:cytosine/adenosine deaminase-related metal-dependent hydrolase